ncbi:MAG: helix-turn-helix domain-containing protein [Nitrincola lacisaponensis]|uniref:Transcriptional regulator, Cro/CI family n=1 Tax=Nitrincola lacisaponensis TaxID=267850 RepID=A0A063Y0G0_9GAMM|nr:helix-turn-helix transcriptional regulator [Nitrincola lacisaponensis]KDE38660.1 Transcriptional regulator, Cro/CI family [Nitrincola lacisaponensis]
MSEDLTRNLRLLCSYYRSISEVCRRLDVNRTQFNRYLSGSNRPSAHMMQRLCDFFGVEEHEILLPHHQFQRLIDVRPRQHTAREPQHPEQEHLQHLQQLTGQSLDKYLGYYFEYYLSMACPGNILRTLVHLEKPDKQVYYQRLERLQEAPDERPYHGIYLGAAYLLTDRIFLVDYESLTGQEISQTILFPSYKNRISYLSGLKIGAAGSGDRMPCATRVLYEYLGHSVNKRQALKRCGLYPLDTEQIEPSLKQALINQLDDDEYHLRARHLHR